jgi:superfamily II DNA/RNA helicase
LCKARLEKRRREMLGEGAGEQTFRQRIDALLNRDGQSIDEDLEDLSSEELETLEEDVVDAATSARTVAELEREIASLADLAELARRVRHSGTDRKWSELREILTVSDLTGEVDGSQRKIIVFMEHRDTLNYLVDRIRTLIGKDEAVVAIHGGIGREERRATQERFTQDPTSASSSPPTPPGKG